MPLGLRWDRGEQPAVRPEEPRFPVRVDLEGEPLFVHRPVVMPAEEHEVVEPRRPTVGPMADVMSVAVASCAAGKLAVAVPRGECLWRRIAGEIVRVLRPTSSTRVAVDINDGDNRDIWTWDLARETLTQLIFDEADDNYVLWTPDSARVVFTSTRDGGGLFWKAADGTGQIERLKEGLARPYAWVVDGR